MHEKSRSFDAFVLFFTVTVLYFNQAVGVRPDSLTCAEEWLNCRPGGQGFSSVC